MSRPLYKTKKRLAEATPFQKDHSKMQRKVNSAKKHISKLLFNLRANNIKLRQAHDLIGWAIKEDRITKEECKKFIKRKKESNQLF